MTFCVTRLFQRRYGIFKKKFYKKINIKNCKEHTSVFHFITVAKWEALVLDGFLNSVFVISPRKKAPTSHFYSS